MSDVLEEALAAEGFGSPVADRVRKYMADRGFYVQENWLQRERRAKEEEKVRRQAAQAAAFALAIPYAGAIQDCQASVYENTRGGGFHRCQKTARFVVRRKEEHSGHRDRAPDRSKDGRLAMCRVHAADGKSHRYHGHWSYEKCADEPVEPEYQPPTKGDTE